MRRCLDCPRLIAKGSRCPECAARYRVPTAWADAVKARDGYRCVVCGSGDRVNADHIVPRHMGGAHALTNGRTLCHEHHRMAHDAR